MKVLALIGAVAVGLIVERVVGGTAGTLCCLGCCVAAGYVLAK